MNIFVKIICGITFIYFINVKLYTNYRVQATNIKYPIPEYRDVEDTKFWLENAEKYLNRILKINNQNTKNEQIPAIAKNIIIFIGDGMGLPTISAGRIYKGQQSGNSGEEENLSFDLFPNIALAKTYNVDKQVPDSAGTATAIFTGVKTNSGVLGYDSKIPYNSTVKQERLTTIMDWAISVGKRTGIVTTTRLTHATPAALYAHIQNRDWECDSMVPNTPAATTISDIAKQLIENVPGKLINVILAGGKSMMGSRDPVPVTMEPKFNGSTEKYCSRTDGRNLIEEWLQMHTKNECTFVQNTGQLLAVDSNKINYLLGLFAHNHLSYNSVRDTRSIGQPSLRQMASKALEILMKNKNQKTKDNGFVLVIEGGRIDQAHHQNHARLALQELLEMDATISETLATVHLNETLIIVTADHSHAMTFNGYPLRGTDILGYANKNNKTEKPYETLTYASGPGYWRHRLNSTILENNSSSIEGTWLNMNWISDKERQSPIYQHQATFPLQDETHGGEDVPVYAIGAGSHLIRGVFEQNYIGFMMSYVGCMGPAKHLNADCRKFNSRNNSSGGNSNYLMTNKNKLFLVVILFIYLINL